MTVNQVSVEPPRVPMRNTLPDPNDVKEGDIIYDITNGRLALRTSEGWKYFTQD